MTTLRARTMYIYDVEVLAVFFDISMSVRSHVTRTALRGLHFLAPRPRAGGTPSGGHMI